MGIFFCVQLRKVIPELSKAQRQRRARAQSWQRCGTADPEIHESSKKPLTSLNNTRQQFRSRSWTPLCLNARLHTQFNCWIVSRSTVSRSPSVADLGMERSAQHQPTHAPIATCASHGESTRGLAVNVSCASLERKLALFAPVCSPSNPLACTIATVAGWTSHLALKLLQTTEGLDLLSRPPQRFQSAMPGTSLHIVTMRNDNSTTPQANDKIDHFHDRICKQPFKRTVDLLLQSCE